MDTRKTTNSWSVKTDIELKIVHGDFKDGKIPSTKKVAEEYNIGMTTAATVMRSLVADDVLYSLQGKGFYVVPNCIPRLVDKHRKEIESKMESLIVYTKRLDLDFLELATKKYNSSISKEHYLHSNHKR